MQSPREEQGEIRKPSSAINEKKQRKTIEWERLEISSRKLEIPWEHFMGLIKDRNGMDLTEAEDIKKRWQEYTEELQTKVCDIVQEAVIQTILKKKNCKKAKRLSEEALQIAEKRREAESKRERERYT